MSGSLGEFTVKRAVENAEVLMPVLTRSHACGHKRPEVDYLREEISETLQLCQRSASESDVDDWAWEVRKLLTFCKRKCQRQEVSTVFRLHFISGLVFR